MLQHGGVTVRLDQRFLRFASCISLIQSGLTSGIGGLFGGISGSASAVNSAARPSSSVRIILNLSDAWIAIRVLTELHCDFVDMTIVSPVRLSVMVSVSPGLRERTSMITSLFWSVENPAQKEHRNSRRKHHDGNEKFTFRKIIHHSRSSLRRSAFLALNGCRVAELHRPVFQLFFLFDIGFPLFQPY
jgi:hypothetical protein